MLSTAGVERVPQDARGAAAGHDLRARDDRGAEGAAHGGRPLPPLRLRPPDGRADRRRSCARVAEPRSRSIGPDAAVALIARHATGSFRDALGTLEQLVTYSGTRDRASRTCWPCSASPTPTLLFGALDAIAARDAARRCGSPRGWPSPGATPASSCATSRSTRASCSSSRRSARCRAELRGHARARRAPGRPGARRIGRRRPCGCSTCWPAALRGGRRTAPTRGPSSSSRWSRPRRPTSTRRRARCWRGSSGSKARCRRGATCAPSRRAAARRRRARAAPSRRRRRRSARRPSPPEPAAPSRPDGRRPRAGGRSSLRRRARPLARGRSTRARRPRCSRRRARRRPADRRSRRRAASSPSPSDRPIRKRTTAETAAGRRGHRARSIRPDRRVAELRLRARATRAS